MVDIYLYVEKYIIVLHIKIKLSNYVSISF